jgi:excinuclease ABC subunit B
MTELKVESDLVPRGDQPKAIEQLIAGLRAGHKHQTLLGVTGSGKTRTMAGVIEAVQRPTLILSPNKTLAAQLYAEMKEFFPNNAIEYFVSYYDYYQPEAYIPRTDTYIEKDSDINEEIDKLRNAATRSLFERRDVIIVASVSCIYGLGSPEDYGKVVVSLQQGQAVRRDRLLRHLVDIQYTRNDMNFTRGTFRVRGDTLDVYPAYEELGLRIEFFGDEIERISDFDTLTGEILAEHKKVDIYPAKHFITTQEKLELAIRDIQDELAQRVAYFEREGKLIEAQRITQRTMYDIEMLQETGYCSGVENYSRHLARRQPGDTPWTLLDYFPDDFLMFIDESHIAIPQVGGMSGGDRSRKENLVEYGFRLPSAMDNRPLTFDEFEKHINQVVHVSATPRDYEREHSAQIVEQIIRPTGLVDPTISVRPTKGQIDDLLAEVKARVSNGQRALITTLTKKMAEDLADYLKEMGIKTHYLHSDIETLERIEILRDLRLGIYDVVVGINLLREGLDLPEVSLVAIMDADKEGYLRSRDSLIQTIGRTARHVEGTVLMYADRMTESMRAAIDETYRRRAIQIAYNQEHGIEPRSIVKSIRDLTSRLRVAEERAEYNASTGEIVIPRDEIMRLVKDMEVQMKLAAKNLEFEKAALLRDQVIELRRSLE